MPCGECIKRSQQQAQRRQPKIVSNNEECDYTSDTTNAWLEKLKCVEQAGKLKDFGIQKSLYNSFLGILISIQRKPASVCYFKTQLDIIQPYILNIINEGTC